MTLALRSLLFVGFPVLVFVMVTEVTGACDPNTGPAGSLRCIRSSIYNNQSQYATCLTNSYIMLKSKGELKISSCFCLLVVGLLVCLSPTVSVFLISGAVFICKCALLSHYLALTSSTPRLSFSLVRTRPHRHTQQNNYSYSLKVKKKIHILKKHR